MSMREWSQFGTPEEQEAIKRLFDIPPEFEGMVQDSVRQLKRGLGVEKTLTLLQSCLDKTGLKKVTTPEELLALALAIIENGGFPSVVARTIKLKLMRRGFLPPSLQAS